VHIVARRHRQVVVEHGVDAGDVEAARGDVSCEQQRDGLGLEGVERAQAVALRLAWGAGEG
jgi:hypothetical protein